MFPAFPFQCRHVVVAVESGRHAREGDGDDHVRDNRHSAHCSPRDELCVGLLYEKFPKRPMVVGETGAVRSTGTYTLELDSRFGTEVHVYPFFMNPGRTEFSDSEHLW